MKNYITPDTDEPYDIDESQAEIVSQAQQEMDRNELEQDMREQWAAPVSTTRPLHTDF